MNAWKITVVLALVAGSCSPSVVYQLEVEVDGVGELHADRLHVGTSRNASERVPVPWATPTAMTDATITVEGRSILVTIRVPQQQAELGARFWYDTNGDDIPNASDRVGRLTKRASGEDLGMCEGNTTDAGLVRLIDAPAMTSPSE